MSPEYIVLHGFQTCQPAYPSSSFKKIRFAPILEQDFAMHQNKKAFIPEKQGQKLVNFCGTTQIGDESPAHFAYYHMQPTDNGQGSRKLLLSFDFGLPSQVHSE
jgi:hypothetical protein